MLNLKKLLILVFVTQLASSCTDVDPTETSPVSPQEVNLVRKNQRVLRYNCKDELVSDKVETVNSIQKTLLVKPTQTENLWSFNAINKNNNSRTGGILNNAGKLTLNISPTVFHMRVTPGVNQIEYTFEYCRHFIKEEGLSGKAEACTEGFEEQRGEIYVFVNYSEELLPGEMVIKPTPASCGSED